MIRTDLALRCYTDTPVSTAESRDRNDYNRSTVLVLDTETTTDEYQNLLFGSCGIWVNCRQTDLILFYNEALLSNADVARLVRYAIRKGYKVMCTCEFVETVFFPYVYNAGAVCVGFNLPFDLSRLAIAYTSSRRYDNGFSIKLSDKPWYPGIVIKSLDSKRAFIEFTTPLRKKSEKRRPAYRGCFVDLRALLFALTNSPYSLKRALIDFQCELQKMEVDTHGRITDKYIGYNLNDTLATHELYEKALERYSLYGLDRMPSRLYSPASIGKAYIDKIGIRSFDSLNPDFPPEVKGYLMTAYYGGRTEVRVRKQPVRVTYLDFTSMYPSLYVLLGLDRVLKAKNIGCKGNTREVQAFLDNITIKDIVDPGTWKRMLCICRLIPDNDILPVRSAYGNEHVRNIGINYLKADFGLWYALPDLVASKLLTGKAPRIEEAIIFVSEGVQEGLRTIEVLKGIKLEPGEDFIKKLIEERIRIKRMMKQAHGIEKQQLDLAQGILKIIANSTSYGIFVEMNTSDEDEHDVRVYGLDTFHTTVKRSEYPGRAFNPIMAVTITSGAKLILAAAEALIKEHHGVFAYCDTDSIFVSPEHAGMLQECFKPLNPYDVEGLDMFKVEDDHEGKALENVWFYGISAKRYVLYDRDQGNGEIRIRKCSSHGLGHLLNIDDRQVWQDLLEIHYHPESHEDVMARYEGKYAVSQLTVSGYSILQRFHGLNDGKPIWNQIKPFNFINVGTAYREADGEKIIPMTPFVSPADRKFGLLPYNGFLDYRTGKYYDSNLAPDIHTYWKPMKEVIAAYMDHAESKSEGTTGELRRRHITVNQGSIVYIGKESNELEESMVLGVGDNAYTSYNSESRLNQKILSLSPEEAEKAGISQRTLRDWRSKIHVGKPLTLKEKTARKIKNVKNRSG